MILLGSNQVPIQPCSLAAIQTLIEPLLGWLENATGIAIPAYGENVDQGHLRTSSSAVI